MLISTVWHKFTLPQAVNKVHLFPPPSFCLFALEHHLSNTAGWPRTGNYHAWATEHWCLCHLSVSKEVQITPQKHTSQTNFRKPWSRLSVLGSGQRLRDIITHIHHNYTSFYIDAKTLLLEKTALKQLVLKHVNNKFIVLTAMMLLKYAGPGT